MEAQEAASEVLIAAVAATVPVSSIPSKRADPGLNPYPENGNCDEG